MDCRAVMYTTDQAGAESAKTEASRTGLKEAAQRTSMVMVQAAMLAERGLRNSDVTSRTECVVVMK